MIETQNGIQSVRFKDVNVMLM